MDTLQIHLFGNLKIFILLVAANLIICYRYEKMANPKYRILRLKYI